MEDLKAVKQYPFDGSYVRMRKKGNGFVVEVLSIKKGKLTLEQKGDWDLRITTETKALNEIVKNTV